MASSLAGSFGTHPNLRKEGFRDRMKFLLVHAVLLDEYRFLFHKARMGIADIDGPITYEVREVPGPRKRVVAHLHSYDSSLFFDIYGEHLDLLRQHCSLVVTYSVGPWLSLAEGDAALRIPNKGMDVGAKFCAVHYLSTWAAQDAMILFLHSKSDEQQRRRYYQWYLAQLPPPYVDGLFNPYLVVTTPKWPRNSLYMNDLVRYFDLDEDYYSFPEGNCFFLSLDMARELYSDKRLYNMLNTNETVDIAWILEYYGPKPRRPFAVNNLHLGKGHAGHADSMLEHAFERLPLLLLRKHKRKWINTTLWDNRVAIMACHGTSPLRQSTIVNNLYYLAQVAFHIVLVHSTEPPSLSDEFIVGDLTEMQCQWYAQHPDLAGRSCDELRAHYREHGASERRFVPNVIARVTLIKTANTPYLCHHKWLVALKSLRLDDYSDFILTNDSILFVRSLLPFATAFDKELTGFVASNEIEYHLPDFLRRYNRRGIEKIRDFYASQINATRSITYDELVREFEIASTRLFDYSVYHEAQPEAVNVHFVFPFVKQWILNGYEIVKLKFLKMRRFDYPDDMTFPFQPDDYKKLNPDLAHLSTRSLIDHFKHYGINEGRAYNLHQRAMLPGFLQPLLRRTSHGHVTTIHLPLQQ